MHDLCFSNVREQLYNLCYVDMPGEWRIRIRHISDMDTPWIRFQPYPKKMDTYWLRYVYPTRMGHVFERETMGRERRESERRQRGCARPRWRRDADGGAECGGGLEAGRGAGVGPEAGRRRMSRRRAAGWPPWRQGADGELLAADAWHSAQARGSCGSWAA